MVESVVTGGQTGADRGGWLAAKKCGLATGGWMPRGFEAEDGLHPEFAKLYGAVEHPSSSYPDRRRANLEASDAGVVFNKGFNLSPGTKGLMGDKRKIDRPILLVCLSNDWKPAKLNVEDIARWVSAVLMDVEVPVLMVAGNRESSTPGIGRCVEGLMTEVFRSLACEVEP